MSDLSSLDRSFGLASVAVLPLPADELPGPAPALAPVDVQPHEVSFRRLRTHAEIARVLPLRQEIQLSVAARADPGFAALEKKETRWVSSGRSSASAKPSAPSA